MEERKFFGTQADSADLHCVAGTFMPQDPAALWLERGRVRRDVDTWYPNQPL